MRRWLCLAASLLISSGAVLYADDSITVTANSADISEGLDLKAVANLFGSVKNLEEFEVKLNTDSLHLCNLDLNGDGKVDYLRVVETVEEDKSKHLIVIQAVLAKDIYQDVATIHVEKKEDNNVWVQFIGDSKIYGKNYVVEPVYIYRPVIYDWFWGPNWICYYSPWYWGYWPGWYTPYPCWVANRYWTHIYVYHYDHPVCSYHTTRAPRVEATQMRNYSSRPTTSYTTSYSPNRTRGNTSSSNTYSTSRASSSSRSSSASSMSSAYSPSSTARGTSSNTQSYNSSSRGTSYSSGSSSYSSSRGSSSFSGGSSSGRGSSSYSGGGSYSGGSRR